MASTVLPAAASTAALKTAVCRAIDARRHEIVALAEAIRVAPELGFKEWRTSDLIAERFRELDIPHERGLALTGVKGRLKGGAVASGNGRRPSVALMGELDAFLCREHPDALPDTGAVHACGHHAQVAAMLGAALGLLGSDALAHLAGDVVLFAVPAEEYVEIEERLRLREAGQIEFLVGKTELLRLGAFDDVDMAMMVHSTSNPADGLFGMGASTNGMVAKFIRYTGLAAHAGTVPHKGINALYAAHVAIAGINALRETFRDEDHVRVHPIITRGGDVVSAVPADVRLETFVRAATVEAVDETHRKVDRALKAGALALGARVEVQTLPGYLPLQHDASLAALFRANAEALVGREHVKDLGPRGGSTDAGDLSLLMPVVHPFAAGATGVTHGADYRLTDPELGILNPAKAMAMTVVDLLADGAGTAQRVREAFQPRFTTEDYLAFSRRLASTFTYEPIE